MVYTTETETNDLAIEVAKNVCKSTDTWSAELKRVEATLGSSASAVKSWSDELDDESVDMDSAAIPHLSPIQI